MADRSGDLYDALYSWKDYPGEVVRLEALIEARRRSPGNRLLDVACGTGRHLELLREHWEVEGVDLNPAMIERARWRLPETRLEVGDMTALAMGRTYDAVVCLFSAIGYARTPAQLQAAISSMARHLVPGGVLAVEPWLTPEQFVPGHVAGLLAEGEGFRIARMNVLVREGNVSVAEFHYLLGRPERVEHFTERHELSMFTDEEYRHAFRVAGLGADLDERGLMGRGLYLGVRPWALPG